MTVYMIIVTFYVHRGIGTTPIRAHLWLLQYFARVVADGAAPKPHPISELRLFCHCCRQARHGGPDHTQGWSLERDHQTSHGLGPRLCTSQPG